MLIVIFPLTYMLFPFHLSPSPVLFSCRQNTWEQAEASSKTVPPNEGISLIISHFGNCITEHNTFPARFSNLQSIPSPDFSYMYAWLTTGGWDYCQVQSPADVLVRPAQWTRLSSAHPPLIRVMGGPRKTDQFVWSFLTVGNTGIYHCLDQTGYGLRHVGIIPSMVASHHQPLNRVHDPNFQTYSSSCTEQDYCRNDSVISRVKLTHLMMA